MKKYLLFLTRHAMECTLSAKDILEASISRRIFPFRKLAWKSWVEFQKPYGDSF